MSSNKRIALYDYVEVDGVALSSFARSVAFTSEDEQVDVSGFNATGVDEFLAGKRARSITIEFFMSRASNEVFQVLYELHRDKTVFGIVWRANVNSAASSTNPELRGSVTLPTFDIGATRGDAEVATFTFISQPTSGLEFYET